MLSNGGGLQTSKKCMVPGYDFWIWFTTKAMTSIICLKNLIHLYWVTDDSMRQMVFIVHWEEFGNRNMIFDMHPCGQHVYYPKKTNRQYGFVQAVADNMKLFTKQQIEGVLKAHHLYETLGYPLNANFEAVLRVGDIGGCTVTVDNANVAYKIW
jgi:hypothetical protein